MHTVSLDLETCLSSQGDPLPHPVCATLQREGSEAVILTPDDPYLLKALQKGFVVGWNLAAFDLPVLMRRGSKDMQEAVWQCIEEGRAWDCMIADRLWYHAVGKRAEGFRSLKDFCEDRLGIHVEKQDTWRARYGELKGIPIANWPAAARDYALEDARLHLKAYQWMRGHDYCSPDGGPGKWVRDMPHQIKKAFALTLIGGPGFPVSKERVDQLEKATQKDLFGYQNLAGLFVESYDQVVKKRSKGVETVNLVEVTGPLIRPTKPGKKATADLKAIQARGLRLERAGGYVWPRTPTGDLSITKDTAPLSGDVALMAVCEAKALNSFLGDGITSGKIAELRANGTYIYRSRYDGCKETGRTGAKGGHPGKTLDGEKYKGPKWGGNIQNLHRAGGIRECFIPPPGHHLILCDFAALELYTLAQLCISWVGYSKLAEDINAGRDPHSVTAANMLGLSYEAFRGLQKADKKKFKKFRTMAKPVNFGLPGGMGKDRFIAWALLEYGVRFTEADFYRNKQIYFTQWPEVREYQQKVGEMKVQKYLFSNRIRGGLAYCDACNGPFQGLGGDAATAAAYDVVREVYRVGGSLKGLMPRAFVHDEIVSTAPIARAPELAIAKARQMERSASRFLPDVPPRVEAIIAPRWSKRFDPYFVDGKLTCCPDISFEQSRS